MKVVVIGGGAAGQMAAAEASRNGNETVLLEQNEKLGKKLYITGKGRCNLTNTADRDEFIRNVTRNPRFLYASDHHCNIRSCFHPHVAEVTVRFQRFELRAEARLETRNGSLS